MSIFQIKQPSSYPVSVSNTAATVPLAGPTQVAISLTAAGTIAIDGGTAITLPANTITFWTARSSVVWTGTGSLVVLG